VSCYAYGLEPCDFPAVFEAYLAGRWWLFGAARQANLDGLVRIGVGRDAAEIGFAMPYGDMEPTGMTIWIGRAHSAGEPAQRTRDALSTEEPAPQRGRRLRASCQTTQQRAPNKVPDEALRRLPSGQTAGSCAAEPNGRLRYTCAIRSGRRLPSPRSR
jgi:hypothetical protein